MWAMPRISCNSFNIFILVAIRNSGNVVGSYRASRKNVDVRIFGHILCQARRPGARYFKAPQVASRVANAWQVTAVFFRLPPPDQRLFPNFLLFFFGL